jgi:hypothetical protein
VAVVVGLRRRQRAGVRDSAGPHSPVLGFTAAEWEAFVGGMRPGESDGPGGAGWVKTSFSLSIGDCVEVPGLSGVWFLGQDSAGEFSRGEECSLCVGRMTLEFTGRAPGARAEPLPPRRAGAVPPRGGGARRLPRQRRDPFGPPGYRCRLGHLHYGTPPDFGQLPPGTAGLIGASLEGPAPGAWLSRPET